MTTTRALPPGRRAGARRPPDGGEQNAIGVRIARFLGEIGLCVRWEEIDHATRLPGIAIDHGALRVDASRLSHPGDLLHEAGHLALLPGHARSQVTGDAGPDGGYEMAAIAWSFAAVRHLQLAPEVVFHEDGYRGGSASLVANFEAGRYIGVPLLQWLGMAAAGPRAAELGIAPYPHMIRWLVDHSGGDVR